MPTQNSPRKIVEIEVPASTSNIGPGFDCLGLALDIFNTFRVRPSGDNTHQLTGHGTCADLTTKDNLFFRAMESAAEFMGEPCPPVHVEIEGKVPQSRGLGSSATAIVAGVLSAKYFLNSQLSNEELFPLMVELEGHPDNVAASLFGSLTASAMTDAGPIYERYRTHHSWRIILLIPEYELSTAKARKAIPQKIPHGDAVANLTRLPLLIDALCKGKAAGLTHLLEDRLHEPYRKSLIKGFDKIKKAALGAGADGFFVSGAGPTVAAMLAKGDTREISKMMKRAAADAGVEATTLCLKPWYRGTRARQIRT